MTRALRVAVCVKQVLDPEAPATLLDIDGEELKVSGRGVAPALDPYSLHALRAALDLRARLDRGTDITVVGAGPAPSRNLYLKALAAGADRAVLLDAPVAPASFADSALAARHLGALVGRCERELGGFDLVLAGRRAADTNAGTVGPMLARVLGRPVVTMVTALAAVRASRGPETELLAERLGAAGPESVACPLPAVVTVSHEAGDLPHIEFARMIDAKHKPFEVVRPADLDDRPALSALADNQERPIRLQSLHKTDAERPCLLFAGTDARDSGRQLARHLVP